MAVLVVEPATILNENRTVNGQIRFVAISPTWHIQALTVGKLVENLRKLRIFTYRATAPKHILNISIQL